MVELLFGITKEQVNYIYIMVFENIALHRRKRNLNGRGECNVNLKSSGKVLKHVHKPRGLWDLVKMSIVQRGTGRVQNTF